MIVIDLLINKKDEIVGFEIRGHANYDEYGKDLVCSAVTILAYSCVNTLDKYTDDTEFSDDEVVMSLEIYNPNRDTSIIPPKSILAFCIVFIFINLGLNIKKYSIS